MPDTVPSLSYELMILFIRVHQQYYSSVKLEVFKVIKILHNGIQN